MALKLFMVNLKTRNSKNELRPAKRPDVSVNVNRFYFLISQINVISWHSCFVFTIFFLLFRFQPNIFDSIIYLYISQYKTIMFESGINAGWTIMSRWLWVVFEFAPGYLLCAHATQAYLTLEKEILQTLQIMQSILASFQMHWNHCGLLNALYFQRTLSHISHNKSLKTCSDQLYFGKSLIHTLTLYVCPHWHSLRHLQSSLCLGTLITQYTPENQSEEHCYSKWPL